MEEVHKDKEENKTIEDFLTEDDVVIETTEKKRKKKRKSKDKENKKINKKVIITMAIIIGVILFIILFVLLLIPKIKLIGDKYVEVEYGETYDDLGCSASFLGRDISDKV